jgi:Pentapeptide repeats (8 copies)
MESEQKIYRSWSKVQPFVILTIILSAFAICIFLWNVQQHNVDFLQDKIENFKKETVQALINNEQLKIEDRLKLTKDILVIEKDATTIQNGVYTPLIQVIGGAILSITAYVGYCNFEIGQKNLKVSEDKQVTERFSKSIEHLGSEKIDIRLGGIYALEQIAFDSDKYHWTIVEILSAFIREKRPLDSTDPVGIDIQAALTVIGRRKVELDPNSKYIDLRAVNLARVEIQTANLSGANLTFSNLTKANLTSSNLSSADLRGSNLTCANLSNADLSNANLSGTNSGAILVSVIFPGVDLRGSNLTFANLRDADLSNAILKMANLSTTNLSGTNLSHTDLWGADLSTSKNLTQEQLSIAIINEYTKLPDYLTTPIA